MPVDTFKAALIGRLAAGLAIALSVFHLLTATFGQLPGLQQRVVHLTVALTVVFLLQADKALRSKANAAQLRVALNLMLALLAVAVGTYTFAVEAQISDASRVGTMTVDQILMGVLLIVLCLEAARQTLGMAFPMLALLGIAYIIWGGDLPAPFDHPPVSFKRTIEFLYFSAEGILGLALGVSSTYLILFVMFGAFMSQSGLGDLTVGLSRIWFAKSIGGEAKVAVVSSGVMAAVTGSDMANAASTGAVTIPLMIRSGYPRSFAAAVEAVASNGAQYMPPVLGTAAFLMAEIVRVPYGEVVLAAIIPGLLFYVLVYAVIHLRSARLGIRNTEPPSGTAGEIFRAKGHLLLPIFVLLYFVAIADLSVTTAALYSIAAVVVIAFFRRATRMSLPSIVTALREGAYGALGIAVACAVVGIMMGIFGVTGLGLKLSGALVDLANGNVTVLLLLTAITSLILGTGLPTLPNYIILAILVAPALTQLGIDPLAAHLFIFYFGNVSSVTPPVALNVIITANIAKADFWESCWISIRLSLATFLLPFAFVYDPSLLMRGEFSVLSLSVAVVLKCAGLLVAGVAIEGYWRTRVAWAWRALAGIGAVVLVVAPPAIGVAGALLAIPMLWTQLRTSRLPETQPRIP